MACSTGAWQARAQNVNGAGAAAALERAVERLSRQAGGVVGVAAIHVETGRRFSLNGGERFPMASVYKLPIALQLLRRVERGEVRLGETVTFSERDFRPGHSPLNDFARQTPVTLSVARVLELMLGESDNTASDAMLRLAGGAAAVTARLRELRIDGIDVSRTEVQIISTLNGVSRLPPESEWSPAVFESLYAKVTPAERKAALDAFVSDPRDTATPDAMAELLLRVQRRQVQLDAANTERLLRIMTETTTGAQRLKGLLPAGTIVAHKTGTWGNAGTTNDAGIVTLPETGGHVVIVIFVKASTKEVAERERAIAEIARTLYDFFLLQPTEAARALP